MGTLGQIIVLFILINLFSAVMMFFGIEFAVYGPYLAWFVAVFIFFKMFAGGQKSILE